MDHYEHEQKRGVEYVSSMHKAMNGMENFAYYSPTHLLKRLSQDQVNRWDKNTCFLILALMTLAFAGCDCKYFHSSHSPPLFVSVRLPPFALLHGTNDIIVPVESSTKFSELLNSLSARVSLYLLPRVDHTEIITDLMVPDRHLYHPIYSCIKQEHRKLLGVCWHHQIIINIIY